MRRRPIESPQLTVLRTYTDPHAALGDPRRFAVFNMVVKHGPSVKAQALLKEMKGIHKATLSRVLHQLNKAGLVLLTTNLDRTLSVAVNVNTLYRITRHLFDAHQRLAPPTPASAPATTA
jgi:hypothetical protein